MRFSRFAVRRLIRFLTLFVGFLCLLSNSVLTPAHACILDGPKVKDPQSAAATKNGPAHVSLAPASSMGNQDAVVTILEFSDFECPFSRQAAPVIQELLRSYPQKIRLVFKHNPLPFHQHSALAHEAALAAGAQGKFWEMHDLLFAHQEKLELNELLQYAKQLQLDMPVFQQALQSHAYAPFLNEDMETAKGLGHSCPN